MRARQLTGHCLALVILLLIAVDSQATIHTVSMSGITFSPSTVTVRYGDTVRWVCASGFHTTTSTGGSAKTWDSGLMSAGTKHDEIFRAGDGSGPFPYECIPHSGLGMTGTVRIDQAMSANDLDHEMPASFSLAQNYPNPFNPTTTIEYNLPERSHVVIGIFNVLGRQVRTLTDEEKPAGNYQTVWDGTDSNGQPVGSGVYLYRITAGDFARSKKMLLMK